MIELQDDASTLYVVIAYGVKKTYKLGFPIAKLGTVRQGNILDTIREAKSEIDCMIYGADVHTKHQVAFHEVMLVIKPRRRGTRSSFPMK